MSAHVSLEGVMPTVFDLMQDGSSYTVAKGNTQAAVAIVDDAEDPYVVKAIPNADVVIASVILEEEFKIVSLLEKRASDCPLAIPGAIHCSDKPPFAIYTKLQGEQYIRGETPSLTPPQRREAGRMLGQFIAWQGQVIDLETYTTQVRYERPEGHFFKWSYDNFYPKYVGNFERPDLSELNQTARYYWRLFRFYYPDGVAVAGDRMTHADLQPHNMTWEAGRPIGVFDWASACVGDVHQELRGACRMGDDVLEAAIIELGQHGVHVDPEQVRFWNRLRVLGAVCYWLMENNTANPYYAESVREMQLFGPEGDWTTLPPPTA